MVLTKQSLFKIKINLDKTEIRMLKPEIIQHVTPTPTLGIEPEASESEIGSPDH